MAKDKKTQQQEDPGAVIEAALNRTEGFIEKNGKLMLICLSVIVLIIGGFFAYKSLYVAPQKEKASAAMFEAQYQFERDSFEVALKGTASFDGFEKIAKEYSSLPQGNIAKHYAGICCLYMGDFKKALEYFESFKEVSGSVGTILTAQNYGLMGDAYMELGDAQNSVKMYNKAVAHSDNDDTAPKYLKKAAMVNESIGNFQEALDQYKKIKYNYPANFLARDIDKYIALVEQKL